ncbi:nontoxic nonhemagglutinin C-terminal domain-containing protein, partial [Clostridium butyricum]
ILQYNRTYELFNYVFPEIAINKIEQNNNIYLSINNENNLNFKPLKFKLLNTNPNKQYVQKWDEVIFSVLDGTEKYLDISTTNNRIQLVDNKNNAQIFIINNDIFISNCLTLTYNNVNIYLSIKNQDYNWVICDLNHDIPKKSYLWILKNI